ncbi:MAG: ribonuclease R [Pirellulaceae bacterium]|nr:ribonuclease R [Pirellulaceae bacterium]
MNEKELLDEEQDENKLETSDDAADEESVSEKASPAARKLEPTVLAHLMRPNYQPVKPRVIAKQLKLPNEQHRALKLCIKRLVQQGKAAYGSGHLVRPVVAGKQKAEGSKQKASGGRLHSETQPPDISRQNAANVTASEPAAKKSSPGITKNEVIGKFRRAAGGFGFVRPSGTPAGSDRSFDVFIPQNSAHDAASGDLVRVRLGRSQAKKTGEMRRAGEIVDILERDTHQFVGVYREKDGDAYVEIDGKTFGQPIPVGDPGAKNAQPGDKIVVEMVRFPSPRHEGEAVITELLGKRGAPGVDTLSIMREFGLQEGFPDDVMDAAREEADKFDESIGKRLDLTGETIITIDPVDARDFDDAISLSKMNNGHWRLGVHIADVSHFVKVKTPLDREAKDRATSVYLPDRVIPMLPEIISNNLASLQPDKVRYCETVFIEFSAEGTPIASEWHKSAIKSVRRFSYEEVDEYLADRKAWQSKLTPQVYQLVADMHELAMTLRKRRLKAGSIELTLPEVKIDLDKSGKVTGAHLVVNTESHQVIEEFMLAANEAVARILSAKGVPFLRRVHDLPNPKKLKVLTEFVQELGIECDSLESRFEIKRVIAAVAGQPEAHAVNYAVLRSMQKAVYSPVEEGHYALNSKEYCHFTSPIRRYPDLTIHRALEAIHRGKKPRENFDELSLLGEHCSEREQRAQVAERELTKVKLLMYLSERIGMQMEAVITGVEDFGLFAQGVDLPAEGLIHVSTLGDDHYRFESRSHSLVGYREGNSYRLGDVIQVEVSHVDVDKRVLDFRVVKKLASAPKKEAKKPRKDTDGTRMKKGKGDREGGKRGNRR